MSRWNSLLSLIASLLVSLILLPEAHGKIQSNAQVASSVTTGLWSTTINSYNAPSVNSPYVITWTGSSRKQFALISIVNNGNFLVNASHISFSSVKTNGDISNPPTITFEICSGAWDPASFNCSGNITEIGSGTSGTINFQSSLSPGNRLVIRLTNQRDASFNYNTTLNSLTYRSDIRQGQGSSS